MSQFIYRITTAGRQVRYGTKTWTGTPQSLAEHLADDTRTCRPDVASPITIHVWPRRDDDHYRSPHPDDASTYNYPTATQEPTR
ncbi:hypothetical protein ACFVX9_30540 [Kitasatospora sp. NPDC058243]|uniref:hypothetical protein n=1 Tax=Kitasatospora sp. NPDC058243 TaxID=3346397 RepID=UPI0036DC85E2